MTTENVSFKTLLKLDFGYTENQLFDLLEEKLMLIKIGYTFNEIFKMQWVKLKDLEMSELNGI